MWWNKYSALYVLVACAFIALLLAGCGGDQPAPSQQTEGATGNSNTIQDGSTGTANGDESELAAMLATATVLVGEQGGAEAVLPPGGIDLSKIDPCSLLTNDDVAAVMGQVDYKPNAKSFSIIGEIDCTFVQMGSLESPFLQVSVVPPEYWEHETGQLVIDGAPSKVADIGDEAVTADVKAWQKLMVLLKGKAFVSIRIYPKNIEGARELAAKVIERLPK